MMPKGGVSRLCRYVNIMNINGQLWEQPIAIAGFAVYKEPKLKLSLETRNRGDVIIVHCQGRIVYRDEASALSCLIDELMRGGSKVVLDLSGVSSMDSAGIGELALLQTWAQERKASLKCAGANDLVSDLLDLTNLDSVLEVHPTVDAALQAFREDQVCADC